MTAQHHGLSRLDQLMKTCLEGEGPAQAPLAQTLGRLRPANPVERQNISHEDIRDALDALSETMRATDLADGPADAGMTFLGQFVDHDITLDATSVLGTRIDPSTIPNIRTPSLDLDCVYGAGPEASSILYGRGAQEHFLVFGRKGDDGNPRDLARTCAGKALIGDPRNDENILVAQIQGLFIELHNILMTYVIEDGEEAADIRACAMDGTTAAVWEDHVAPAFASFEQVRRFIRLHYQWIVWHELLPAFVDQRCLDRALAEDLFGTDAAVMPVEFSGACYRFGHATTQFAYQLQPDSAPVGLFDTRGFEPRPVSANIDMALFFQMTDGPTAQRARPVGTRLGEPLFELPFIHGEMMLGDTGVALSETQARKLALRNMIRDRYTYQLASGQQMAAHLGTQPVPVPDALAKLGITKTPLWFYALQEADDRGQGKLTDVGGLVVASVFATLLKRDQTTVLHLPHFQPWAGFGGQPSCMAGLIAFVEANRDRIPDPQGLMCG